jgi:hypothetical protein
LSGPYNINQLKSLIDAEFQVEEILGVAAFNALPVKNPKTLYFIWVDSNKTYMQQVNIGSFKIAEEIPV